MSSQSVITKSLAILPFRSHREKGTENDVLSVGIAESVAMRLVKVEGLKLTPTSSVRQHLSQTNDSFALGKLLQVDYILEGYIFPSKERTRFTVQLLNVPDKSVVWAAQFDERETDVFLIEDHVSERIINEILPHLKIAEKEPITDAVAVLDTGEVNDDEILSQNLNEPLIPTLAQTKEKRFPAYRAALAGLLIFAVLIGGFFIWSWQSSQNKLSEGTEQKTIIILPFQNAGLKPTDNSLGIGLAETLTGNLGHIKNLFVLSANAGRDAARGGLQVSQIGLKFNANYIIRGTVKQPGEGNEIQAFSELIETKSEKILWNKTITASDGDLDSLQSQITEAVLDTLSIETSAWVKQNISKRVPGNGLSYEIFLVGRYQMATRSHQGLHKAISAFNQALERDPEFALAYVGLADAYALENLYEIPPPPDAFEKAKYNALQALKLDENLAEAHASLGYILSNSERNYELAERHFRRAIELNPSYATSHHWFSTMLTMVGRHDEAVKEIKTAQKLDPQSSIITAGKGLVHFYAKQYPEAITEYEKVSALDPGFVPAHKIARWTFQAQNNFQSALATFQREKSFSGNMDAPGWLVIESQVVALSGDKNKARELLEKALSFEEVRTEPKAFAYEIALAYSALEDRDKTIEWLEKAEASGNHSFNFTQVDPRLDKFRTDERFGVLVNKLKSIRTI